MKLAGSECRVLCILDEVIALRSERPKNVWTSRCFVSPNEAVPHHQLARAVVHSVPDTTTFLAAGIAIDGAKDHLHLGGRRSVEDATTSLLSYIIRDGAVDQPEHPSIVGDATAAISQITRDCAVVEGQLPSITVDTATASHQPYFPRRCY